MEPNVCLSVNKQEAGPLMLENPQSLNFTSINSDCMQLILDYLEWQDLVNVAETCRSLKEAACGVFKRKYSGHKRMALGCNDDRRYVPSKLDIMSQLMQLKVLRNFGHTISNLHVHMSELCRNYNHVLYVNKYCNESMEHLSFSGCNATFFKMKKPFTNVRTLKLLDCPIFSQPEMLTNEVFPNLNFLKLKRNYHKTVILHHMPKLLRFSFTPYSPINLPNEIVVYENDIIDMIKVNPQVEVLQLHLFEYHGIRILQYISKNLQSLRKLNLTVHDKTVLENSQELLPFDNVEDFHLLLNRHGKLSRNPFVFRKLKSFTATNWIFDFNCMIDFFDKNKDISSVDIHVEFSTLEYVHSKIFLQNLEEFRFYYVTDVPIGKILDILKQTFRLKKFYIRGHFEESYQDICNAITLSGAEFKEKVERVHNSYSYTTRNINVLELFVKNAHNTVMRSVLQIVEDSSSPLSMRWYSDNSAILRLKKYIHPLNNGSYYFKQLDNRLTN